MVYKLVKRVIKGPQGDRVDDDSGYDANETTLGPFKEQLYLMRLRCIRMRLLTAKFSPAQQNQNLNPKREK